MCRVVQGSRGAPVGCASQCYLLSGLEKSRGGGLERGVYLSRNSSQSIFCLLKWPFCPHRTAEALNICRKVRQSCSA